MKPLHIILGIAGATALAGLVAAFRRPGGGASSTPSTSFGPEDDPSTVQVSANEAAAHKAARPIIEQAIQRIEGRPGTPQELQYGGAVGWLETNYGRGWSQPEMKTANNWGAVSCKPTDANTDTCVPGQTDHYPDGTAYTTGFRKYPTSVDGAADELTHILKIRPMTYAALHSSAPTFFRASYAMRRETYYGGFCPVATKKYGQADTQISFKSPDKNDATRACSEEAVSQHAHTAHRNAMAIAKALGEPLSMPLGTYEDADAWYRAQKGIS